MGKIKSELQYYNDISTYSAKEMSMMRRFILVMRFFGNDVAVFSLCMLLYVLPILAIVNSIRFPLQNAHIVFTVLFLAYYPVMYHVRIRPRVASMREDAANARKAYLTVVSERAAEKKEEETE